MAGRPCPAEDGDDDGGGDGRTRGRDSLSVEVIDSKVNAAPSYGDGTLCRTVERCQ
jgi:hypothetical protein